MATQNKITLEEALAANPKAGPRPVNIAAFGRKVAKHEVNRNRKNNSPKPEGIQY